MTAFSPADRARSSIVISSRFAAAVEPGNADVLERLFKPELRGEKIGAICMTEPNAGSDLDSIATSLDKLLG